MATDKPLTPTQRAVLSRVRGLRRYTPRTGPAYAHTLNGKTVRDATIDALFERGLIRADGYVGADMTFALTEAGYAALDLPYSPDKD